MEQRFQCSSIAVLIKTIRCGRFTTKYLLLRKVIYKLKRQSIQEIMEHTLVWQITVLCKVTKMM